MTQAERALLDALATLVPLMAIALIGLLVFAGWLS